jgi:hypothetical protein
VGLGAEDRFLEGEVEVVAQVAAPARSAPRPAAEHVPEAEEVTEDVAEVGEDRGIEAARAAQAGVAVGVVALLLVGVAEHAVGLGRLLEALLGLLVPGVAVGMILEGELPVGGLDLLIGGGPRDPEDLVVVALGGGGGHFGLSV